MTFPIPQKTVLSLEQSLSLPYATERFVQLGWRVIRIENPGEKAGDPNRYIGEDLGQEDLHSYFLAQNLGKEAITINLKSGKGQELLKRIIKELKVDIFLCNSLPRNYTKLGFDYETLINANPNLIWCGISAFGPDEPDRAGYDPALQAELGFMYLTGEPEGNPVLCGLPLLDLKAGDEAFSQVMLALLSQYSAPGPKRIDVSMVRASTSWLITALPQLAFVTDPNKRFRRSGSEHRSFIPSNCYKTRDGYVYLTIGSDQQWKKFTEIKGFQTLQKEIWKRNQGRFKDKDNIYHEINELVSNMNSEDFTKICMANNLAVAPINSIHQVSQIPAVARNMVKTKIPSGKEVSLFPAPVNTEFMEKSGNQLPCAPRLGEHNRSILRECGLEEKEIYKLRQSGVI